MSALSAAAVPIVVWYLTSSLQSAVQRESLDREYVGLAVSVLREKASTRDLREWAIRVMTSRSPVAFSAAVEEQLKTGKVTLPKRSSAWPHERGLTWRGADVPVGDYDLKLSPFGPFGSLRDAFDRLPAGSAPEEKEKPSSEPQPKRRTSESAGDPASN